MVPSKLVEARDVGDLRLAQAALPGDQHVGGELALRGVDPPEPGVRVPGRAGHLGVEAHVRAEP